MCLQRFSAYISQNPPEPEVIVKVDVCPRAKLEGASHQSGTSVCRQPVSDVADIRSFVFSL